MKTRALIIVTSLTVCGLSVGGAAWQGRQLRDLREAGRRLNEQLQSLHTRTNTLSSPATPTIPTGASPSAELLRLRNQVSQLARRERELAGVKMANSQLPAQANPQTNAAKLPASYVRTSEARNLGFATPEATLETFLWAHHNHDLTVLLACYPPQDAATIKQDYEKDDGRFKGPPGINVIERRQKSDDSVELVVEFVPGSGAEGFPLPLRRINGEWKLGL